MFQVCCIPYLTEFSSGLSPLIFVPLRVKPRKVSAPPQMYRDGRKQGKVLEIETSVNEIIPTGEAAPQKSLRRTVFT